MTWRAGDDDIQDDSILGGLKRFMQMAEENRRLAEIAQADMLEELMRPIFADNYDRHVACAKARGETPLGPDEFAMKFYRK